MSAESLKRDLDSKMSLLERLNNPQIEHRNSKVLKSQIVGSPVRTLQNSSSQARLIEESKISNQLMEERAKVDHSTENKSKSKQKKKTKAKKGTKVKKQTKIKPSSIK